MNEVEAALSPLPEGYSVSAGPHDSILIGCKYPEPEGLGFAITAITIQDGNHVDAAVESFGALMHAVETGRRSDGANTDYLQ
jgi:hypothetical protein